jgi:hypothetical protein
MSSEWMRVMLEEIARKKTEADDAQAELERRGAEAANPAGGPTPAAAMPGAATPDVTQE